MGHTAIAEIQFADYIFPAFDQVCSILCTIIPRPQTSALIQIVNEAAKYRYRAGGQFSIGGLTIRTPTMAVGHGGLYHSQSPEGFFVGASGLKVYYHFLYSYDLEADRRLRPDHRLSYPGRQFNARGCSWHQFVTPILFFSWNLRFCIVLQVILYNSTVSISTVLTSYLPVEQVPIDDFALPLSRAEILSPGSDLTLLSWGTPIYHCESALNILRSPPASLEPLIPAPLRTAKVELIDLRTILPWDVETVVESVKKTRRLVIVHEAGYTGGFGGEIAAEVQKKAFLRLEAPVKRVTGWE